MAQRTNQPRLNQPRAVVLDHALTAASWSAGHYLLSSLSRLQLDAAAEAAADLHDYEVMLGLPNWAATVVVSTIKINPEYARQRDVALAPVAEMDRCTAQPAESKRRVA